MRKKILKGTGLLLTILLISLGVKILVKWNNFNGISDTRVLPLLRHLLSIGERGNISATDGRFLYDLIIEKKYKSGLELGTSMAIQHSGRGLP